MTITADLSYPVGRLDPRARKAWRAAPLAACFRSRNRLSRRSFAPPICRGAAWIPPERLRGDIRFHSSFRSASRRPS